MNEAICISATLRDGFEMLDCLSTTIASVAEGVRYLLQTLPRGLEETIEALEELAEQLDYTVCRISAPTPFSHDLGGCSSLDGQSSSLPQCLQPNCSAISSITTIVGSPASGSDESSEESNVEVKQFRIDALLAMRYSEGRVNNEE